MNAEGFVFVVRAKRLEANAYTAILFVGYAHVVLRETDFVFFFMLLIYRLIFFWRTIMCGGLYHNVISLLFGVGGGRMSRS